MAVKGRTTRSSKKVVSKAKNVEKKVVVEEPVETVAEAEIEAEVEAEAEAEFDLPSSESEQEESESESEEMAAIEESADVEGTSTEIKGGHSITKSTKTKQDTAKSTKSANRAVIYIGRLPDGFEENELKTYFQQFGEITQLRLSRNKKTGRSKHYAFIEFSNDKVAEIAVETMDNYLLMGHQLKCNVLSPENVNENLFKGANKRFKTVDWSKLALLKSNAPKTNEKWQELQANFESKTKAKQDKLKSLGIDYDLNSI